MRSFKSLLVSLIGLTALMYALQNFTNIDAMRQQIDATNSGSDFPAASWTGFAVRTLGQLVIAAVALKGAWNLFAARKGTAEDLRKRSLWLFGPVACRSFRGFPCPLWLVVGCSNGVPTVVKPR